MNKKRWKFDMVNLSNMKNIPDHLLKRTNKKQIEELRRMFVLKSLNFSYSSSKDKIPTIYRTKQKYKYSKRYSQSIDMRPEESISFNKSKQKLQTIDLHKKVYHSHELPKNIQKINIKQVNSGEKIHRSERIENKNNRNTKNKSKDNLNKKMDGYLNFISEVDNRQKVIHQKLQSTIKTIRSRDKEQNRRHISPWQGQEELYYEL